MEWISSLPQCPAFARPSSGIDSMIVPDDCSELLEDIRDGAAVCDALTTLDSADTDSDWQSAMSSIEKVLENYWNKHNSSSIC
jgi:inactivated superfamily I helicase